MPCFSHGGFDSSSLRECIELLDRAKDDTPATLHSGVGIEKKFNPPHLFQGHLENVALVAKTWSWKRPVFQVKSQFRGPKTAEIVTFLDQRRFKASFEALKLSFLYKNRGFSWLPKQFWGLEDVEIVTQNQD